MNEKGACKAPKMGVWRRLCSSVTMEDRHRGALTERNDNETDDLPVDAAGSIERHADNVAVGHCEIENDV